MKRPGVESSRVTQWVEEPAGGRDRGPKGVARAWIEVLVRPARFFRTGIGTGDQAPGLVFALVVVLIEEASRFGVVYLAARGTIATGPFDYPVLGDLGALESLLLLLVVVVFVAPITLHLVAALQTILLRPFAPDRGGVSETVQVIAYATAPCVFAGLPVPAIRLACVLWGTGLYVYGTSVVHDVSLPTALAVGALPALIVFGYAYRGVLAGSILLGI